MQRRTSARLLKGLFNVGAKRPVESQGASSATTAASAASSLPHRTSPPSPPYQPYTTAVPAPPTAAAAAAAAASGAASLVNPPSPAPAETGAAPLMRKKKIIRRVVKRKKVTATAGAPVSGAADAAGPAAAVPTSPPSSPAARNEAAAATAADVAPPPRRGLAMLSEIRKQPEGAIQEGARSDVVESDGASPYAEKSRAYTAPRDSSRRGGEGVSRSAARPTVAPAPHEDDYSSAPSTAAAVDAVSNTNTTDGSIDDDNPLGSNTSLRKTPMVKGYRLDEVVSMCSDSDAIFARRLPSGGCQFFAWPGTPLAVASAAIVSMPDTIRTVHAVFGRSGTPMDLVLDIDCPVPQEYWSMQKIRPFQQKVIDDVLTPLKEEIEKIGEQIETQVVLQSPNLKKASFHVHTRLKDAAFADFNSVFGFLYRFQERLPNVDLQIYRPNGMLRMFGCMKENYTSAIVVFDDPRWNIGFPGGKVSDEQASLHSLCVRERSSFSRLLTFEAPRAFGMPSYGGSQLPNGAADSRSFAPQVLLPRTEKEAVETASRWLRQATEVEVGEWRSWIGLGLTAYRIAYHFRNAKNLSRPAMEEMLDAWTEASRKCPLKYHAGECENRWATFDPEKMHDYGGWWPAFKRLGRLEVPSREAMEVELMNKSRLESLRETATPSPVTPPDAPTKTVLTSASHKVKQQQQRRKSSRPA